MDRRRVSALLTTALAAVAVAAGCLDPTGARTRRDFEQTGRAQVGEVEVRIDQGVAVPFDEPGDDSSRVRLRANAPEVAVSFTSAAAEPRLVRVRLDNVAAASCEVSAPAEGLERISGRSLAFSVTVPPGGEARVSVTRPGLAAAAPFRFAWVGDVQGGVERFGRVRAAIDADPTLELVLFAGDVTQNGTSEEVAELVAAADALAVPWYAVLGNHETTAGREEEFQKAIGRLNVSFDYRGVRFLLLDSASATLDERVYRFLDERLSQAGAPALRLAAMHVPPLDYAGLRDAGFASRAEGAKVLSRLSDGGVDLLLAGHIHTLRLSGAAGVEVVVSGEGGVGLADPFDGVGTHFLAVQARPEHERFDVTVMRVE